MSFSYSRVSALPGVSFSHSQVSALPGVSFSHSQILNFAPMAIPAVALLQQHDAWRDILIEPAARQRAAIEAWGHSELGRNRATKTNRLVLSVCDVGVLWPNGWMDQDAIWYGGRPQPSHCTSV